LKTDAETSQGKPVGINPTGERKRICTYLEWDSKFFERRIARLNRPRLDDAVVAETLAWCGTNRIECLYFLADSDHPQTPRLAESNDFLLTDVRMTFERTLAQQERAHISPDEVRLAREDDLNVLRAIARTGHRDTRFYFDEHFDQTKCELLYETWIENSFRGFAQAVLVALVDQAPAAYLTCHFKDQESQIGLVGVDASHQGKGLGTKLVQHFLSWSREQGASRATVVTQGRNIPAQRLYQRNGFATASLQLWYHRWFGS
jgi:dTDP-4-amino-4,6-dideoxy-D-galactose acyltransferase